MSLIQAIQDFAPTLSDLRRHFHRHPELGTQELWTQQEICRLLDSWGIPHQPIADTGVVALVTGTKPGSGNTVALRADIDALPLTEDPNRPYCSTQPGCMHACGHDAHTTIALGVGHILQSMADQWSGQVKLLFQPAEESVGGAERMVQQGCMSNPTVDYVLGLHVMPSYEVGEVEYRYGKLNAATDELHLTIQGKGCHGAYPDLGVDAIVIASAVVSGLQSLVSRRISPLNNVVLTLGTIQGGTAPNILCDQVTLTGTLRTTDPDTRAVAVQAIQDLVTHTCQGFGGTGICAITPGYAALINDDTMVDQLLQVFTPILGKEQLRPKPFPSMGGEDFSFFLEKAPGVFYHLGCANKAKDIIAPLHSPQFDIDEDCLALGVRLQCELALHLLQS